jgi:hypothetical protein
MELPSLRHFRNEGIFHIKSDVVEALHGETWIPAVYTDKGWATADGSTLLTGVEDWRYAIEEGQQQKNDAGKHQNAKSRQASRQKQAVAIAYAKAGKSRKRKAK